MSVATAAELMRELFNEIARFPFKIRAPHHDAQGERGHPAGACQHNRVA